MFTRHVTLIVAISALLGWLLTMLFGDVSWLAELMMLLKVTFLNALRLIIGPLIFFSLITGILSLGDRDPAADRTPPGHDSDRRQRGGRPDRLSGGQAVRRG